MSDGTVAPRARSAPLAALCCAAAGLLWTCAPLPLWAQPSGAPALSVTVLRQDGRPLPGAVITVHSLEEAAKPAAPVHAVMDQVHQMFTPDLLVIPVGSTVEFPNSDTTRHEVYSFSPAHPFQLPLYRGKPYPPQHFDKAGLVTLGCNIHDSMLAYILVTDGSFYGLTDASGRWSAAAVPSGRYRIEVWHPRFGGEKDTVQRTISIGEAAPGEAGRGEAGRMAITIRLEKPLRPAMLDRMSSWDAY